MASRHLARSIAMQSLFEWDFYGKKPELLKGIVERNKKEFGPGLDEEYVFIDRLVDGTIQNLAKIDKIVEKAAPQWPIEQITAVDRAILRLGLYELLFGSREEVPPKVAINEAIELAKSFGGESSGKFVNGVLGTVYRGIGEPGKEYPTRSELTKRKDANEAEGDASAEEFLASAVIFRREKKKIYVAMVKDVFGYWTFVKGHIEPAESPEAAALREVKEEVGLEGQIVKPLGKTSYVATEGDRKIRRRVTVYLVETGERELTLEPSTGLTEAKWVALGEVMAVRHYEDQNEIIERAIKYLQEPTKNKIKGSE